MTLVQSALLLVFPVAMAFAAANDLFTMRIPNMISIVLVGAFAACVLAAALTWQAAGMHLAVGAGVLLVSFTLFSFNLLGGGDAKLLAAGALWMGVDQVVPFIVYVTIFGGVLSLLILAYRRYVPASNWALPHWALRLHENGGGIPYGIAIAASGLLMYPHTVWFKAVAS